MKQEVIHDSHHDYFMVRVDSESYERLKTLARKLCYSNAGKTSTMMLIRAISKLDAVVLEELLDDANEEEEEEEE